MCHYYLVMPTTTANIYQAPPNFRHFDDVVFNVRILCLSVSVSVSVSLSLSLSLCFLFFVVVVVVDISSSFVLPSPFVDYLFVPEENIFGRVSLLFFIVLVSTFPQICSTTTVATTRLSAATSAATVRQHFRSWWSHSDSCDSCGELTS